MKDFGWRTYAKSLRRLQTGFRSSGTMIDQFADILKHAAALPPHSAIYWHQMNVDAAGVVHEGDKALPALYAVANAPIFAFNDAFFGGEVVGGPMNSVVESSRLTAAVAIRILGGEKAGDIKIPPSGFRNAEIRLAAIAALGHQREQAAAGKRSPLSRADDLAAIFLANGGDPCRAGDADLAHRCSDLGRSPASQIGGERTGAHG